MRILYFLQDRVLRYNELEEKIPRISLKVLTSQLRQLEQDGVISRMVYAEIPPRVEYSLTPIGEKLIPMYRALEYLDMKFIPNNQEERKKKT